MAKKKEKWWKDVSPEKQKVILKEVPAERCYSCAQANKSFYEVREVSRAVGTEFDIVTFRILGYCTFCDSPNQSTDYHKREWHNGHNAILRHGDTSPSRFGT